ncbi:MAG: Mu transposase C-terminal domain-containing protein [Candidatus Cloacimonetes bacterium]|nr:Mu transposase C-terminal domain-containing protein [Candidatus Cloacimonadota bacterium]
MSRIKGDKKKSLQCTVYPTVKISETEDSGISSYDINELEESNDWIDIKTTVNLSGLSRQTIQKRIKQNRIQSITVKKPAGGLKTFINVYSLPVEYQQKWKMYLYDKHGIGKEIVGISAEFSKYSDRPKRRAFAKEIIIKTYLDRRDIAKKNGIMLRVVDVQFQRDLDQKLILIDQLKTLGKFDTTPDQLLNNRKQHIISLTVIKKWLKMWKDAKENIAVLCDNHDKCGRKRTWSEDMKIYIVKLVMHRNNYTYRQIHNKTQEFFGQATPSYDAIHKFINNVVMSQNRSLYAHVRGKKAVKKISSYVPRINDAYPGDLWISDGYVNKFLVYSPYHLHPDRSKRILLRPVVVYWLDTATELITGYAASYSERFDVVISSFSHAVERFGVPKGIMTDNAGSFHNVQTDPEYYAKKKNDTLSKRTAIKYLNSGYPGFFEDIGVERVVWTTPGNPQAKKIEPYNHKIFDEFEKDQLTYLGKTPEQRPEAMHMTNHLLMRKYGDKILNWEQFLGALDEHIEKWNNTKRKNLNDLSAKEYYLDYSSQYPLKKLSEEEMFLKLSARKTLKLRGKQIELMGNLYRHPSFEAFINTEVQVIYNVRDLHSIHIATIDGKLLEGKAHIVQYGSQTNKIMTADAIHARNYYEKQNKAVYFEIIQQGGLTNKLRPSNIDQAYINANNNLLAEESLRIDNKIKDIHKNSSSELEIVKNKKIKSKKVNKPKNPRPVTSMLDKLALERIENEEEAIEVDPGELRAKELMARLKKERGIPAKRRILN